MNTTSATVLSGKRILLGISGGIAAYKCAELLRLLSKAGAEVQVVMTRGAQAFIGEATLQALSGRSVRSNLFDLEQEAGMGHIELARWADLVLIAPATAHLLSQLAAGNAADLLTTLVLATDAPVAVAPAMNQQMWANPATVENVATLCRRGVQVWGPGIGDQACGEVGPGRMLEPVELLDQCRDLFATDGRLDGVKVLLTAGPTREPIDPVRYIGNRSSGKMGFALAEALVAEGAAVTLVAGPVSLPTPRGVVRVDVESAAQMHAAVMQRLADCQLFAACAAVADYRVEQPADQKIKKSADELALRLVRNPDILADVAALDDGPFTLGFAAETERVLEHAEAKRQRKRVDMIAANRVGGEAGGFEDERNALTVLWDGGSRELPMKNKKQLARELVALLAEHYHA